VSSVHYWLVGDIESIKNGCVIIKKKMICFENIMILQSFKKGDYVVVEGYLLKDKKLHGTSIIHWTVGKLQLC